MVIKIFAAIGVCFTFLFIVTLIFMAIEMKKAPKKEDER